MMPMSCSRKTGSLEIKSTVNPLEQ